MVIANVIFCIYSILLSKSVLYSSLQLLDKAKNLDKSTYRLVSTCYYRRYKTDPQQIIRNRQVDFKANLQSQLQRIRSLQPFHKTVSKHPPNFPRTCHHAMPSETPREYGKVDVNFSITPQVWTAKVYRASSSRVRSFVTYRVISSYQVDWRGGGRASGAR